MMNKMKRLYHENDSLTMRLRNNIDFSGAIFTGTLLPNNLVIAYWNWVFEPAKTSSHNFVDDFLTLAAEALRESK